MFSFYYTEMLSLFTNDFDTYHTLSEEENPYLLLRPPGVTDVCKDELRIKKKNEWVNLGYEVEIDTEKYNLRYKPFTKNLLTFSFEYNLNLNDKRILEAIRTGKKIFINTQDIINLLNIGYSFEDIISIPDYLKLFIQASISYSNSDLENALTDVEKAIFIIPYDEFYELYFLLLLALKKEESFDEYITYYHKNYSRIINNETLFKWLRLLLKKGNYEKVIKNIDNIRNEINTNPESKFVWGNTIKKFEKNVGKIYEKAKKYSRGE